MVKASASDLIYVRERRWTGQIRIAFKRPRRASRRPTTKASYSDGIPSPYTSITAQFKEHLPFVRASILITSDDAQLFEEECVQLFIVTRLTTLPGPKLRELTAMPSSANCFSCPKSSENLKISSRGSPSWAALVLEDSVCSGRSLSTLARGG